jgi:uncharacterized protein YbjT (DUF2867 family)
VKVFVTGATGYIGGSIAEKLVASGHEVRGLVSSMEKEKEKIPLLKARGINPVVGTLDIHEILTSAVQTADGANAEFGIFDRMPSLGKCRAMPLRP